MKLVEWKEQRMVGPRDRMMVAMMVVQMVVNLAEKLVDMKVAR